MYKTYHIYGIFYRIKQDWNEAFSGDKKLANITLKTTKLKKSGVGKDAFKNIKKNATFKVPAKKVSDYKAIFKSKGAGKNIKIKKL